MMNLNDGSYIGVDGCGGGMGETIPAEPAGS